MDDRLPSVLVLEPDVIVRTEIAEYLRACGYRVAEAADGKEAMQLLTESGIAFQVLLADATASGVPDGFEIARWVRSNKREMRIILSGTPERASDEAGGLCEDGPMLVKPYDHQILLDRIKRLIAARDRNDTT
jgi:DNA-binding response OmpR family regulator